MALPTRRGNQPQKAKPEATGETRVIIGGVRFSYAHVFEPVLPKNAGPDDSPKYSVLVIVPKTNVRAIQLCENAIESAIALGIKGTKKCNWGGVRPRKLESVWRDGDEDNEKDDPNLYGCMYFNATGYRQPGVIDKDFNPIDPNNPDGFYSGCWGRIEVNFYPYEFGKKGIAAGLNNIQKIKEGEPLAGFRPAESAFAEYEENDDLLEMDDYPEEPVRSAKASTIMGDEW